MKIIPSLLICVCSIISLSIEAQTPCDEMPPYFYDQAEVIHDTTALHEYCLNLRPPYEPAALLWPGCPSVTIHNPAWLVFTLPYDSITFEIRISDCIENRGAQFSIYELPNDISYDPDNPDGIQPEGDMLLTDCKWNTNPYMDTIMFDLETEAGQHYGLITDGWSGDQCKVEIQMEKVNEVLSEFPVDQRVSFGDSAQLHVVGEHVYTSTQWQVYEGGQFVDITENSIFQGVNTDTLTIHSPIFKQDMLFRYALGDNLAYVSDTFTVRSNYDEVRKHESISIIDEGPTVFPNPFRSDIRVEYDGKLGVVEYQVFDVTGRLHQEGDILEPRTRLHFEHLAQGLYFMHFKSEDQSWVRRIIRKR